MGGGTRENQYKKRFGQGKPIDTYGIPCIHTNPVSPANDKERAEALSLKDTVDSQSSIFWKQAIAEAVQDSNLKALASVAEDMGDLKGYYENGEPSLVLKGTTTEGRNLRVYIPPDLIKAVMAEEGPIQVEITDLTIRQVYSFYRDLHDVKKPAIGIPLDMTNFQVRQEVVATIKPLPIWNFMNQLDGKASEVIGFKEIKYNGDLSVPVLVANLGGKEIPIESFNYGYLQGNRYYMGAEYRYHSPWSTHNVTPSSICMVSESIPTIVQHRPQ